MTTFLILAILTLCWFHAYRGGYNEGHAKGYRLGRADEWLKLMEKGAIKPYDKK